MLRSIVTEVIRWSVAHHGPARGGDGTVLSPSVNVSTLYGG